MSFIAQDTLTLFVTFLSYTPEPWVWLVLGILLVVCSTERVRSTNDDVYQLWSEQVIVRQSLDLMHRGATRYPSY
jgi:hypothetical protein